MYVCVCGGGGGWEAVIWCMGVGVKADRMRTVIIHVPMQPVSHINVCNTVYYTAHFYKYNQCYSI